jgi:hypothetical protein
MLCFTHSDNGTEMTYTGKITDSVGKLWDVYQCPICKMDAQEEHEKNEE